MFFVVEYYDHQYTVKEVCDGLLFRTVTVKRTLGGVAAILASYKCVKDIIYIHDGYAELDAAPLLYAGCREVYQCTPEFTLHDAHAVDANVGGCLLVDGSGSFGESFSHYADGKVVLRSFGLDKSIESWVKGLLACAGLTDIIDYNIPKYDEKLIKRLAIERGRDVAEGMVHPYKMARLFDKMSYQGARVAFNIRCHDEIMRLHSKLSMKRVNPEIVSMYVKEFTVAAVLYLTKNLESPYVTGPLFDREWVRRELNLNYVESNPARGIIKTLNAN